MYRILTMIFVLFLPWIKIQGQGDRNDFRIMCYNTENLFDTTDNPQTQDNDFLPEGSRHWTGKRYSHKIQQIAKVIIAAGEWSTPALIGLCEIENDSVLHRLLQHTPLRTQAYRYCRTTGQDVRGIQVALLYQRDKFQYEGHAEYPVIFTNNRQRPTRNILHVWGKVITGDRLDVLVCHMPSRYGGALESEQARLDATAHLRHICDSLAQEISNPKILIMGDFNDTPKDRSIQQSLIATPLGATPTDPTSLPLYYLFPGENGYPPGSHKYQGEWSQLDQILLSPALLDPESAIHYTFGSATIFAPRFLFTEDKTWRGERPFRSYYGYKYEGGFSDHLPLLIDLEIK